MRVIGVGVQGEMNGFQSGIANSCELSDTADRANHFEDSTFCPYILYGLPNFISDYFSLMSDCSSGSPSHTTST